MTDNGKNYIFKFLNLTDYEQRLFLEQALKICHKVIAKKNFEIGVLTSERDEARYVAKQRKSDINRLVYKSKK